MPTPIEFFESPTDGDLIVKDGFVFQYEEDCLYSSMDEWVNKGDVETFIFLYPEQSETLSL